MFETFAAGACRQGFACGDGLALTLFEVCDGALTECFDGSDEREDTCASFTAYTARNGYDFSDAARPKPSPQELLQIEEATNTYLDQLMDTAATYGSYAALFITALVLACVLGPAYVLYTKRAREGLFDATTNLGYKGVDPAWLRKEAFGQCAKAWTCVWEFKGVAIIVYSFHSMMQQVFFVLATQSLPQTCRTNPVLPRYNTTLCDDAPSWSPECPSAAKVFSPSTCHSVLSSVGASRLFQSLRTPQEDGVLDCSCTRLGGPDGTGAMEDEYATGYTVVLTLLLVAMASQGDDGF